MGCAVGDFDNDGFDDLVVTFLGGVRLLHNQEGGGGKRRFVDVTTGSGLDDPHWATSCAWGDIDGDGLLDLYVCNYVETDPSDPKTCFDKDRKLHYQCSPTMYPLTKHRLFRNLGKGKFRDVTEVSGVGAAPLAPGLAVVMVDLDGDGRLDIFVANDMYPSYLFHNQGGGKFQEKAMLSGCGIGPDGLRIAGMGVAVGDLDGSARPSLFVTNFQKTPNVMFLNRGGMQFDDVSMRNGIGAASLPRLKWGTVLFDADLDGLPDLAVVSGHVHRTAEQVFGTSYAQSAQIFLGIGGGKYKEVSDEAGADFIKPRPARALACADFDNDGRPDLAVGTIGGPIALLRNNRASQNSWISLDLVGDGKKSNRNAIGATVKVEAGGKAQHHWVIGGGSYLSASDRRLLIGLGTADKADKVTVRYPSGVVQTYTNVEARRWWRLREGNPVPEDATPKRSGQK
jgi:hypothetical protein